MHTLPRRITAELLGTALLVAAVIGSGIMAERLAGGNIAIALLANTIATGAALIALILAFGGISGAHFNPAVSISDAIAGGISKREATLYIAAQSVGGIIGTVIANLMFALPIISISHHARSGTAQLFSEFIATFGLTAVIWGCAKTRASMVPFAVGAYITAAYWFTASTSFANPAVTLARTLSDTFAGIRPQDAPPFIVAQLAGALTATAVFRWLIPDLDKKAPEVLMPHPTESTSATKTYIFACVHNAGRSQMAAAFFNLYATEGCRAISAGTAPAARVHPEVMTVMGEIGIDLSSAQPRKLTQELAQNAQVLVTMGCGETCPFVPGLRVIDWSLPDPKGQPLEVVRQIRDEIHEQVKALIKDDCGDCCSELVGIVAQSE
ncbi:MAG: family channel protein [Acidobacteriales bacterium]|nr:family channel protein [Terriglobales bacterium]